MKTPIHTKKELEAFVNQNHRKCGNIQNCRYVRNVKIIVPILIDLIWQHAEPGSMEAGGFWIWMTIRGTKYAIGISHRPKPIRIHLRTPNQKGSTIHTFDNSMHQATAEGIFKGL